MPLDPGAVLKAACDSVLSDKTLCPEYKDGKLIKTFCNIGARKIAQAMGCSELDSPEATADVMCAIMQKNESGRWKKVSGADATIYALSGVLCFAAMPSERMKEAHGHIAAVYPVGMQPSGSLGHDVPMLANIGKQNWKDGKPNPPIKSSEAFPVSFGEADYFAYIVKGA